MHLNVPAAHILLTFLLYGGVALLFNAYSSGQQGNIINTIRRLEVF